MNVDADMRRKIVTSVVASLLFVALLIWVGIQYSQQATDGEGVVFTEIGSTAFVVAIALFILLMGAIGVYLDRQ